MLSPKKRRSAKPAFPYPLVNAHTHAAMLGFRGRWEDLSLKEWLEKHIWPAEKKIVTPDFVYRQTKKAVKEMKQNGIGVFNDMYFFEKEVARAAEETKIKAIIGEGILDFPTPSAKTPAIALKITEELLKTYKNNPYVSVAVAPHSIYAVNRENLLLSKKLARHYQTLFHIHLAETKSEFENCLKRHQTTPVGYLDKLGLLDEKSLLAHCVWLTKKDIQIIARRKAKVIHCPLSNLKLGSGIAPISQLLENGVTVCLGTDGPASSNRLDIWEAGKFAGLLQKGINQNPKELPIKEIAKMMTVNGLKSLNIKKINGQAVSTMEKDIEKTGDFNFLYEKNSRELKFCGAC